MIWILLVGFLGLLYEIISEGYKKEFYFLRIFNDYYMCKKMDIRIGNKYFYIENLMFFGECGSYGCNN